jgi:hypothetical protein
MRSVARAIPAGGLGFAVSLLVAACGGGSGLLTGDQSNAISNQLSQISSALQAGDCSTVSKSTVDLAHEVAQLPASVNPTLRSNLDQGVSTVGQLANQECRPASTTRTTTSSTSTTSSTTTTTSTPTQTSTTAPATTTTSTTSSATTPSSTGTTSTGSGGAGLGGGDGGSGSGNGNSAGSGSGGAGATVGSTGAVAPGGTSADNGNGGNRK